MFETVDEVVEALAGEGYIADTRLATTVFLVTRLDYSGDYNGERNYALSLESSGAVATL